MVQIRTNSPRNFPPPPLTGYGKARLGRSLTTTYLGRPDGCSGYLTSLSNIFHSNNHLRNAMMRVLNTLIASCLSLYLASPTFLYLVATSSVSLPPSPASHNTQGFRVHDHSRSWLVQARDSIIESIWSVSSDAASEAAKISPGQQSKPPQKVLARYGGDVVLRFDVKSPDEAEALSSAVRVLFLDVWESTPDWADIRLSKDVVSLALQGLGPFTESRTRYHRYLVSFHLQCSMLTLR